MQKTVCRHCDDYECESSVCPICGERTELVSTETFWCKSCNAPTTEEICPVCGSSCHYIAANLRPVFPEERLLVEILLDKPMEFKDCSCYSAGGGTYFFDGKKYKLDILHIVQKPVEPIIKMLKQYEADNAWYCEHAFGFSWIEAMIACNKKYLNAITFEAVEFIRQRAKNAGLDSMFVSFSGGKDSTVVSSLVMEALGREDVIHIYGDTTLEYPTTLEYVKRFRKEHPKTPFLVARNSDQDFSDLCRKIGPPSRLMRWCCSVFKTGPINRKIEMLFKDKSSIPVFQGIRACESVSRSKYDRVSVSPKIAKQIACQPILDWQDFDVWLYIIANGIDFNFAYRQGFTRVGCWCCPNNSSWAGFLADIYMHKQHSEFNELLYDFAKQIGKPDWKDYIDNGNWKARQGGNGLEYSASTVLDFKPCVTDEASINFELQRPISNALYTLFIPFGIVDKTMGNPRLGEVYVIDHKTKLPLFRFTGKEGKNLLKVTFLNFNSLIKNRSRAETMVKAQLTKYQMCIGCSACASICRHSAIKVENLEVGNVSRDSIKYSIDREKCVGCLECILHFDSGCYMKKVLRVKKESGEIQ